MTSYLKVINPSEKCTDMPEQLAYTYPYPLDPFQEHAVAAIHKGENVLVTAKTGSGKTLVGEYQIHYSLAQGKRVFYTTPIKSLSNQKFHDLKAMFPSVGILTGDIKFKPDAQIVVMTTEILRNMLYKRNSSTVALGLSSNISCDDLGAVVFDEVHYINNAERGKVWEETLILLPPSVQLILLSATLAAPEAFANWIGALKQKTCVLISTAYRVVPLTHYVIQGGELRCIMDANDKYDAAAYNGWLKNREGLADAASAFKDKVKAERAGGTEGAIRGKAVVHSFLHTMNATINMLAEKDLLPALFFVFSRKDCEKYAKKVEGSLIDSSDSAAIRHIIEFHLHRYSAVSASKQYHELFDLLVRGIAYHHSGLLPLMKEIVEILFGRGLIKVMFCTETFAVGINMPTKTAVFLDLMKYDDKTGGQRCLHTDEYLQMAGRAGRRGKDKVGTVIYLPQRHPIYLEECKAMMKGSTRAISSKMDFHYDFLLKTLQSGSLKWLSILKDSYWFEQRRITTDIVKKELVLMIADYEKQRSTLTDLEFADLQERYCLEKANKVAVNAARKEAQRALDSWKNKHMGPKWDAGYKLVPSLERLSKNIELKKGDLESLSYVDSMVEPRVHFLIKAGFMKDVTDLDSVTKDNLTLRGILATEVNESHSLLTAEIYAQGLLKDCSANVILTVLSAFINEKFGEEPVTRLADLDVPTEITDFLRTVDGLASKFMSMEESLGIPDDNYWARSLCCVEPVWRWLNGESSGQLCADYGIYEGNLMRVVLRIANIADEWINLATYCEHTEMVTLMTTVKGGLLRDIAVTDSLYLRI
jgi:superfamily II RNA helicase